jgi:hypothetical protein
MIMALFQSLGGREAAYYVVPFIGAAMVWFTALIGTQLAGPWAGVAAGALMLSSPAFLTVLVAPMSDVPAGLAWSLAVYLATRRGLVNAAAAGLATSAGIMIRPNLVPLALIVVLTLCLVRPERVRRVLLFGVAVLPSVASIAALNAYWYGSPLRSGYGTLDYLFAADRIWPNLLRYAGWLVDSQTPALLLAPVAAVLTSVGSRAITAVLVLVFPGAVLALYLPYLFFEEWFYLRFLLPAYPVVLGAQAAVITLLARRFRHPAAGVALATGLICLLVTHGFSFSQAAFGIRDGDQRYLRAAQYVNTLPPASVVVTLIHSGSLRYYTGRDILRWDLMGEPHLDDAVAYLSARGHGVYLVVDPDEIETIKRRFARSEVVRRLESAQPADLNGTLIYRLAQAGEARD